MLIILKANIPPRPYNASSVLVNPKKSAIAEKASPIFFILFRIYWIYGISFSVIYSAALANMSINLGQYLLFTKANKARYTPAKRVPFNMAPSPFLAN